MTVWCTHRSMSYLFTSEVSPCSKREQKGETHTHTLHTHKQQYMREEWIFKIVIYFNYSVHKYVHYMHCWFLPGKKWVWHLLELQLQGIISYLLGSQTQAIGLCKSIKCLLSTETSLHLQRISRRNDLLGQMAPKMGASSVG